MGYLLILGMGQFGPEYLFIEVSPNLPVFVESCTSAGWAIVNAEATCFANREDLKLHVAVTTAPVVQEFSTCLLVIEATVHLSLYYMIAFDVS